MRLIPYETFRITTYKTPDEILAILENIVEPLDFFYQKREKPFCGSFSIEKFKFFRNIWYRNSFLPVINGRISTDGECTGIEISARMTVFTSIFCSICIAFLLFGTVLGLIKNEGMLSLLPFAMASFIYLLVMIPFNIELKLAKKEIEKFFIE